MQAERLGSDLGRCLGQRRDQLSANVNVVHTGTPSGAEREDRFLASRDRRPAAGAAAPCQKGSRTSCSGISAITVPPPTRLMAISQTSSRPAGAPVWNAAARAVEIGTPERSPWPQWTDKRRPTKGHSSTRRRPQCATRTGIGECVNRCRVTPPRISSRKRACP